MTSIETLNKRFSELSEQLEAVLSTKYYEKGDYSSGYYVDNEKFVNWQTKAKNLLSKACGENSVHFEDFVTASEPGAWSTNHGRLVRMKAVFEAAREDYQGGFCDTVRNIVQAEVFDNELEQAHALLKAGYYPSAALIGGVVLETTLRQLCRDRDLPIGKLDKMNADLAKAGHYSKLRQKQITALADIRNSAAHGEHDKFGKDDVVRMLEQVETFVSEQIA